MQETSFFHLKKPEAEDFVDVETDFHETLDTIDAELKKAEEHRTQAARQWRVQVPLSAWSEAFPYTATVPVADMRASYSPFWGIENAEATPERARKVASVQLKSIKTQNGSLRVECVRKPKIEFTLVGEGV